MLNKLLINQLQEQGVVDIIHNYIQQLNYKNVVDEINNKVVYEEEDDVVSNNNYLNTTYELIKGRYLISMQENPDYDITTENYIEPLDNDGIVTIYDFKTLEIELYEKKLEIKVIKRISNITRSYKYVDVSNKKELIELLIKHKVPKKFINIFKGYV